MTTTAAMVMARAYPRPDRSTPGVLRGRFPLAGAYVRDLDTGTTLYARKENVARPPASVEKLYTTSTALLRFGPTATLHTQVVATGALDELGVWRGDLYLRGAGAASRSAHAQTRPASSSAGRASRAGRRPGTQPEHGRRPERSAARPG